MKDKRFTFLCTQYEREQLTQLANHHHRSQSDLIRMLIRNAFIKLSKASTKKGTSTGIRSTLVEETIDE